MNPQWLEAFQYQRAIARTLSPGDYPPITDIQQILDLPAHMPPNYDFSRLAISDFVYIIGLAKKEIEEFKNSK